MLSNIYKTTRMKELITPFVLVTEEILKTARLTIQPFIEKPGVDREVGKSDDKSINASDLFSFFTADIINEHVVFTR